jgi:DNA-binding transcriptional LysR family regulator
MIDVDALVSLRAVATSGSVVGAAEALGYTPSAVSQQVKRLERASGVPLLERVGRGVMLTRHGRHLVEQGSRLLAELEQLEAGLHRQADTVAGQVRLTAFSTAMRVLDAHPQLVVTLAEREPWDTVDLVARGECDLGVVHSWGDVPLHIPEHVQATRLTTDLADVVVHRDHDLAHRDHVTPSDLVDERWIATPAGTICRQWLDRMYVGTGRSPRIAHVAMEFESHLALVRAGLGVALVPRLGRSALSDELRAVPVEDPVPVRTVLALHRRSMGESPAITALLDAMTSEDR